MERVLQTSRSQLTLESFNKLEAKLKNVFQPVRPRSSYIDKLKKQLLTKPSIYLEKKPKSIAWFFVVIGLFGGVAIVWLINKITKETKEADA